MDASHGFDFPLADLSPGQQAALDAALTRERIDHVWAGTTLQVDIAFEARVSTLIDQARGGILPAAPTPAGPGPSVATAAPPAGAVPTVPIVASPTPVVGASPYPAPAYGSGTYATTGYGAAPGYYPAAYPTTNGLAIASLVCSLISICSGPLLSIPGVVCGHIARRQIANSGGTQQGDGLALAGLIIGWIVNALYIVLIVAWLAIFLIAAISSA